MPLRIGLGCLALLTLAMYFDTLVAPGSRVVGQVHDDLALHFLWRREFGFGELAMGNLALWNSHIFSGAPFFGAMQSALLYPPNWLFLALPLATNWSIALSVWLLGAFVYLWAWRRLEYAPLAFHVGAIVSVMAWATWIVAAVLLWRRERRLARA
jgi:hypothetical protein